MKKQSIIRAVFISVLLGGLPAATWAFSGPFASLVTVEPGVQIDVDVRWPDVGSPPAAGWPVIFYCAPRRWRQEHLCRCGS